MSRFPLTITAEDLIAFEARDTDGKLLKQIVEDLLDATVLAHRKGRSVLRVDSRHFGGDGGVDAAVDVAIPEEEINDWFGLPSVWQVKRGEKPTETNVKRELNAGAHQRLKDRLSEGYAYRWVVGLEIQDTKKYEDDGKELVIEVVGAAWPGDFKVIDAGRLARWLSCHPLVAVKYGFIPLDEVQLPEEVLEEYRKEFERYVPPQVWQDQATALREFCDPEAEPDSKVFVVGGPPGVGKTRFVIETLHETETRWVYAKGEDEVHQACRAFRKGTGVLVADEYGGGSQHEIERLLGAGMRAIRISNEDRLLDPIAPDAPFQARAGSPALLQVLGDADLRSILEANNKKLAGTGLDADSLIGMSGGYLRLLIFILEDPTGAQTGDLWSYLAQENRLGKEATDMLAIMSLARRVGVDGKRRVEIDQLFAAFEAYGIKRAAHDKPLLRKGFLQRDSLYMYVTPQRLIEAAFHHAWRHYCGVDGQELFEKLQSGVFDENLAAAIHDRFRHAPEPMKTAYSGFFFELTRRSGLDGVTTDAGSTMQFISLMEADPSRYAPLLVDWLEHASAGRIRLMDSLLVGMDWSPRRELIFSLTRLAAFEAAFSAAEHALLLLAVEETEGCRNQATGIWKSLFAPAMAGTCHPFTQRLALLERRARSTDPRVRRLALDALTEGPQRQSSMQRIQGPVGGRPLPPEDNPELMRDLWQRGRRMYETLIDLAADPAEAWGDLAVEQVLEHFSRIGVSVGLPRVRAVLERSGKYPKGRIGQALRGFVDFIDRHAERHQERLQADRTAALEWLDELWAGETWAELKRLLNERAQWLAPEECEEWRRRVGRAFDGLSPDERLRAIEELASERSAGDGTTWRLAELGRVLGERAGDEPDEHDPVLRWLLQNTAEGGRRAKMLHGWLFGHLAAHDGASFAPWIASAIESIVAAALERSAAEGTVPADEILTLLVDFGPELDGLRRILGLIDREVLDWQFLLRIRMRRAFSLASDSQRAGIVKLVADRVASKEAAKALTLLAGICPAKRRRVDGVAWWREFEARKEAQSLISLAAASHLGGTDQYHLKELLGIFIEIDAEWVLALCLGALDEGQLDARCIDEVLHEHWLSRAPRRLMQELGARLLSEARWRLRNRHLSCIADMPVAAMLRWLENAGAAGAAAVASHLPRPEESGFAEPLPAITTEVLEHYGDQAEVLERFILGPTNYVRRVPEVATLREWARGWAQRAERATRRWEREWALELRAQLEAEARRWEEADAERSHRV